MLKLNANFYMNLTTLTLQLASIFKNLYSIEVSAHLDWHPALEREGIYYQSSVCDDLSDRLRVSPASIARTIQQECIKLGFQVEIDNRGFLYIEASRFESPEPIIEIGSVVIYIQPPTSDEISLYYLKLLSQIAVQLEMLRKQGIKAEVYVPSIRESGESSETFDASIFYGGEGLFRLLEILQQSKHPPKLETLSQFQSVFDTLEMKSTVTLWVTTDLLSLPNISATLSSLRRQIGQSNILNIRSVQLEFASKCCVYSEFRPLLERYGLTLMIYLSQLEHSSDLDWNTPQLQNSLNLNWLLASLDERINLMADVPRAQLPNLVEIDSVAGFLLSNQSYMEQRAAFYGDSIGFLAGRRKLVERLHKGINKGQLVASTQMNNVSSFPPNFSSIISGF